MMEGKRSKIRLRRLKKNTPTEVIIGKKGETVMRKSSSTIIPIAICEALIIGTLMALNYLFRYNSDVRYNSDMLNYGDILIPCNPSKLKFELSRPYYEYGNDNMPNRKGLELKYDLPEWVFFLCAILTPILIFSLIEGLKWAFQSKLRKEIETFGLVIIEPVRRIIRIIGCYLLGGSITGLFVCIFKFNVVSPRPHFVFVCSDNQINTFFPRMCSEGGGFWSPSTECESEGELVLEALKSFPSYHAALAVYSGFFTSYYVNAMVRVGGFYGVPLLFYLGLFVMTIIGATHRLSSGYSFSIDILSGAIIGIGFAYFVITVFLKDFKERTIRRKRENSSQKKQTTDNHFEIDSGRFTSDAESNSDFDSDSSDDYKTTTSQIGTISILPRVAPTHKAEPMQAINPTMNVAPNNPKLPPKPPIPPPMPLPREPYRPSPHPTYHHNDPLSRSTSTVGTTFQHPPQNPPQHNQSYNIPRQRNSAPLSRHEPPPSTRDGYSNYGFQGDQRQAPRGILSAYDPPPGRESSSYF